ncbi:glycerophosphoryl diester phosphodiesterase membrane domain-containing protein [Allosphingosinicella vermicomposti]|uniref:glycerophosphoryl diester phosphodiesterase membrane domain-containing protein n=1 Tax=Allosphingosinicella vermicomposti TaxID=614671 RepID=UPI000D0F63FB|nr:glycerophosphoryl diester phosphodiesterase membrane domain-containing protein [Allosphingosinicella vermicomposti]
MTTLSISQAWNETTAFVKREAGLLFPIALAFLAVPTIILQFVTPQSVPGQPVEGGPWLWLFIPVIVATMIGSLSITTLAIRPAQSVGDAIGHALKRLLPILLAVLILSAVTLLIAVPALLVIFALGLTSETAMLFGGLVFLAIFTFIWIRVILMTPVAVAEPVGAGGILRRSWALTRGHFSPLIMFATVIAIVAVVAFLAITLVFGSLIALVAGPPEKGNVSFVLSLVVSGIASAVFSVYFQVAVARIYVQLTGGSTSGM